MWLKLAKQERFEIVDAPSLASFAMSARPPPPPKGKGKSALAGATDALRTLAGVSTATEQQAAVEAAQKARAMKTSSRRACQTSMPKTMGYICCLEVEHLRVLSSRHDSFWTQRASSDFVGYGFNRQVWGQQDHPVSIRDDRLPCCPGRHHLSALSGGDAPNNGVHRRR